MLLPLFYFTWTASSVLQDPNLGEVTAERRHEIWPCGVEDHEPCTDANGNDSARGQGDRTRAVELGGRSDWRRGVGDWGS
jgi:hypothetical protein